MCASLVITADDNVIRFQFVLRILMIQKVCIVDGVAGLMLDKLKSTAKLRMELIKGPFQVE